jgi:hypothetical protein
MKQFDRKKLDFLPLAERKNKSDIREIAIGPDTSPEKSEYDLLIQKIADRIIHAKKHGHPIIISFGAHLVKNGLGLVLRKFIEKGYVTHLATNGAGSIHDWEIAFQGKTEEDVREYIQNGRFGLWDETGRYINLSLIAGASQDKGYGESVSEMIHKGILIIPDIPNEKLIDNNIMPGKINISHPFRQYSIQDSAFSNNIPLTVHPGFGYDIIYTHPLNDGASIGKASEIDFLRFAESISNLEGGIYLSIGSAIMSPMIFEKALSMARNFSLQQGKNIKNFSIVINDVQEGNWDWNSQEDPPKDDPAYYLRFCKSFHRMGAKEVDYINEDNRIFLLNLYNYLKAKDE